MPCLFTSAKNSPRVSSAQSSTACVPPTDSAVGLGVAVGAKEELTRAEDSLLRVGVFALWAGQTGVPPWEQVSGSALSPLSTDMR
jgi:hypothetical protein